MKIIFLIGSLRSGGKERRLIELISYLKSQGKKYEMLLVINYNNIEYPAFESLEVPLIIIKKQPTKKDPKLFYQFYQICKNFRPHIIHAWGGMQLFYSIPTSFLKNVPLINSQIASAPAKIKKFTFSNLIDRINFLFSTVVLSNSQAGLNSYNPPKNKSKVIYNGINLNRFVGLPPVEQIKIKYNISTKYSVVMVASFSKNKDFDLFYRVAESVTRLRSDISFIGAGGPTGDGADFNRFKSLTKENPKIIFTGRINDVEALVNACDIGVLFSPNGEGISNSILEYMALGKPVIANDAGGTKELLRHNENGYLINANSVEKISRMIIDLIDNPEKRLIYGQKSREIINKAFSLEKMGKSFEKVYNDLLCRR